LRIVKFLIRGPQLRARVLLHEIFELELPQFAQLTNGSAYLSAR
jgi:hypothetical protein